MYYPFIRGRQYDLIALRSIDPDIYHNGLVLPIIEPVSIDRNVLTSYRRFNDTGIPFILITNPKNGDLTPTNIRNALINNALRGHDDYYLGFHINQNTTAHSLQRFLDTYKDNPVSIIHYNTPNDADGIIEVLNDSEIFHHVFLKANLTDDYLDRIEKDETVNVILRDGFTKKAKNSDYATVIEETFSDLYKRYVRQGYDGFSDFCTIGEGYDTSGFTPLAVAIHLTYEATDRKTIKIRHFVSDRMEDRIDTPGKFFEAIEKLATFVRGYPTFINTTASDALLEHYDRETYPGLPSIKKLSIMHHIEMMSKLV